MKKSTLAEATVTVLGILTAAKISADLHAHNVSLAVIIPVIACIVSVAIHLASDLGKAITTTLYSCPTKGCIVSSRVPKELGPDAHDRYRAHAANHAEHTDHTAVGTR